MGPKNIPVGPLSAVSPKTLRSVYRVLMWNLRAVPVTVQTSDRPTEEDEEAAWQFARAIRFCFSPAAVRRAGVEPTQCRYCLKEIEEGLQILRRERRMAAEEGRADG